MRYQISEGQVAKPPYKMVYKHFVPEKSTGAVLVLIVGGGHSMKVWEETPDGRKGWAPLFAENGRDVIIVNWATPLETLTQKENITLIKAVIEKETAPEQKLVFLGWSMGGPQAFILAADVFPKRTVAILGYEATGPLNFYNPELLPEDPINLIPQKLSETKIEKISNSSLFPHVHREKYISDYLVPIPPLLEAIHTKHSAMKERWEESMVKNPGALPPLLLIYGSRAAERPGLREWLNQYQKDVSVIYLENVPHLGMLSLGNEKIAQHYLDWLSKRGL